MAHGGYKLTPVETISTQYYCGVCRALLRDAMETPCNHVICKSCLGIRKNSLAIFDDFIHCPECKINFNRKEVKSLTRVNDYVKNIKIFCKSRTSGCGWSGIVDKYPEHDAECLYKKAPCPNDGCYVFLMRKVLSQHVRVCDHRTVTCKFCSTEVAYVHYNEHSKSCTCYPSKCTNTNCSVELPKDKLQHHLKTECLHQTINCTFFNAGCKTKIQRKNLSHHLNDCTNQHMLLLMQQIDHVTSEMTFMKQELDIKTKELQLAALKISSLEKKMIKS